MDAGVSGQGDGTAQSPHRTIAAAVAAASNGAVICVAEGTYAEQTQSRARRPSSLPAVSSAAKDFKVRNSAAYVTKATGKKGDNW